MIHVYLIIIQILSKIRKISILWHIFPLIVICQLILTIKIQTSIIATLTILVMIYIVIVTLKEKEKIIEKIMEILLIK